jgi:hypothetical protein
MFCRFGLNFLSQSLYIKKGRRRQIESRAIISSYMHECLPDIVVLIIGGGSAAATRNRSL